MCSASSGCAGVQIVVMAPTSTTNSVTGPQLTPPLLRCFFRRRHDASGVTGTGAPRFPRALLGPMPTAPVLPSPRAPSSYFLRSVFLVTASGEKRQPLIREAPLPSPGSGAGALATSERTAELVSFKVRRHFDWSPPRIWHLRTSRSLGLRLGRERGFCWGVVSQDLQRAQAPQGRRCSRLGRERMRWRQARSPGQQQAGEHPPLPRRSWSHTEWPAPRERCSTTTDVGTFLR